MDQKFYHDGNAKADWTDEELGVSPLETVLERKAEETKGDLGNESAE